MTKDTRCKKIEKMIFAGLKNLFTSQDDLVFDKFTIVVLESLMLLEREEYLKSSAGRHDSGNGGYIRDFRSLRTNGLQISIPRSRKGAFKSMILELIKQQKEQVNQLALLLYRKGLSTRDVSSIMEEFFGESISRDSVNNLAQSFNDIRRSWLKRPLDAYYKTIYCDAMYVPLRRNNSYTREAMHIIYGVKDDNTRELLLLEVNPTEGSNIWGEYLAKLSERGVEQVDLMVIDGVQHFEKEVLKIYPESDIQRCVVHLQRSMLNKIRPKDKKEFSADLKEVFNNFESTDTKQKAIMKALKFVEKWREIYSCVIKLSNEEYIRDYFTYIEYPVEVRRMIYTTNSIENLNRQIRKITKTKVTFDKESNLLDLIYMVIKDFEFNNWQKYPIHNFKFWPKFTQAS